MHDHLISIDFGYLMNVANRGRAEMLRGRTTVCIREVDPSDLQPAWRISDISSGVNLFEVLTYDDQFWWPVFYNGRRLCQQEFFDLLNAAGNDIVRSLGAPSFSEEQLTLDEYLRAQTRKIKKYDIEHHDECVARLSKGALWTIFSQELVFFNAGVPGLYYQKGDNSLVLGPSLVRGGECGNHGIGLCDTPGPGQAECRALAKLGLAIGLEEMRPECPDLPGVSLIPKLSQHIDTIGSPVVLGEVAKFCERQFFESLMLSSIDPSREWHRQIRELNFWYEDLKEELELAQDCRTTVRCFAEICDDAKMKKYRTKIQIARSIRRRLSEVDLINELTDAEICSLEHCTSSN